MLNACASYFTKLKRQIFRTVENARRPCKRTLEEWQQQQVDTGRQQQDLCNSCPLLLQWLLPPIKEKVKRMEGCSKEALAKRKRALAVFDILSDDEESFIKHPYRPLRKKMRSSKDEALPPINRTLQFKPTLRLGSQKYLPLAVIDEEDEPAKAEDMKFSKTMKATYQKELDTRQSSKSHRYSLRPQEQEAVPSTSTKTIQPKQNTYLRHKHEGADNSEIPNIQQSSKSKNWPRNCLRKANYSSSKKKPLSNVSTRWQPTNIIEGLSIEEKMEYQQLLGKCTLNSLLSPSQSIYQELSSSSNSSRLEAEHSRKENTSSEDHKTQHRHHKTHRTKAPLSDITMRKEFRNSRMGTKEPVIRSGSLCIDDEEECTLGQLARQRYHATANGCPLVDLSDSDLDGCESIKDTDSDSDSVVIVDEFLHGSRKSSRLKDLYDRKWTKIVHEKHSSIGQKADDGNRSDEELELGGTGQSQIFQDKVEKRMKYLGIICDSKDRSSPSVASTKRSQFPPLTPEMQADIEDALIPNPPSEVLITKFYISFTRKNIATLDGMNWLNDEVINFYLNLIMERSINNKDLPKVYVFNTFFYTKLCQGGQNSVCRWTKKVDIFSYDILLVPIHLDLHWCMVTVDFKEKCVSYYDSMHGSNTKCLELLLEYIEAEHLDKKRIPYRTTGWKLKSMTNIPEQLNGADCGVFSCMFAEYKSRLAPLNFKQEDMPYIRRRMVYEIIQGELLT